MNTGKKTPQTSTSNFFKCIQYLKIFGKISLAFLFIFFFIQNTGLHRKHYETTLSMRKYLFCGAGGSEADNTNSQQSMQQQ